MFWADHAFALEMDDMIKYVQTIQQFHFELNNNLFIAPSDRELVKRSEYLKSIIVAQDMEEAIIYQQISTCSTWNRPSTSTLLK